MLQNTLKSTKRVVEMGIDTSKNYFQLHGIDAQRRVVLQKRVTRANILTTLANIPACTIGIEACASSHYWHRKFSSLGHTVKMLPAKHVKAYVLNQKNDSRDAAAICEALSRPDIHPVEAKSIEQQDLQLLHRLRQLLIEERTALVNQTRSFLGEFGVIIPQGITKVREQLPLILEDADNELSSMSRETISFLNEKLRTLDENIAQQEKRIATFSQNHPVCKRLESTNGFGSLTATAMYMYLGNGKQFKNGRCVSASLGVVPRQRSSGNKQVLGRITKTGNRYLRYLLVNAGRSIVKYCDRYDDDYQLRLQQLIARKGKNKAAVAVANKLARIAWAIVAKGVEYKDSRHKKENYKCPNTTDKLLQGVA
jgi:transposase